MTEKARFGRLIDSLFAAGFLGLLWIAPLEQRFRWDDTTPPTEKRFLAPFPPMSFLWKEPKTFCQLFASYYDDHFGFRNRLIRWHDDVKVRCLGESPVPSAILGKDGWLFYGGERSVEYARHDTPLPSEDVESWRRLLERRRAWLARRGIVYLFVAAPNKETIYPEFLPDWMRPVQSRSILDQILSGWEKPESFLDLRPALLRAKMEKQVYVRTDTHWSDEGAFVAYGEILEKLKRSLPSVAPPSAAEVARSRVRGPGGDLAALMGEETFFNEERAILRPLHPTAKARKIPGYMGRAWPPEKEPLVIERAGAGPRVVLCYDSFAVAFIPFLAERFSRVVCINKPYLDGAIIEKEKPDVVISELAERYLLGLRPQDLENRDILP